MDRSEANINFSLVQRDDMDSEQAQLLNEPRDIERIAGEAIQVLGQNDFEHAALGVG
jgi:hypothetical protein